MDIGFRYSRCVLVVLTCEETGEEKVFALPWQMAEALSYLYATGPQCEGHCHNSDPEGTDYPWDNNFLVPPRFREHDRNEDGECLDPYRFRRCMDCGRVEEHPDRRSKQQQGRPC